MAVGMFCGEPHQALAAKRTFVPKIFDYFGSTRVKGKYEWESSKLNNKTFSRDNTDLREQLELGMLGYIYHERFITFRVGGSLGIQERRLTAGSEGGDWEFGSADEFEFRAIALPRHPYNLEIFTRRQRPMILNKYRTIDQQNFQSGVSLRYLRRPWNTSLHYNHDVDEGLYTHTLDRYRGQLNYFSRKFIVNTNLLHSISDVNSEEEYTKSIFNAVNKFSWRMLTLRSSFSKSIDAQESYIDNDYLEFDRSSWQQTLNSELPWNFAANFGYGLGRASTFYCDRQNPAFENSVSSNSYSSALSHRLFRSLSTSLQYSRSEKDTARGADSDQNSYQFSAAYSKELYWGSFTTGYYYLVSDYTQIGTPQALFEGHELSFSELPGIGFDEDEFKLDEGNIDDKTIVVQIRNPDTDRLITLTENIDYEVYRTGLDVYIRILRLPSDLNFPKPVPDEPPISYQFLVSYELASGNFTLDSTSYGYNFGLSLLRGMVGLSYAHTFSEQDLVSGVFPNELDTTESDSYGITFNRRPYRVYAQYIEIQSELNPETRWKLGGEYKKRLSDVTTITSKLEYQLKEYLAGKNDDPEDAYDEEIIGLHAMVQRQLARKAIYLSLYGDLIWRDAQSDSIYYSLNSAMTWRFGKTEANLGAAYGNATSTYGNEEYGRQSVSIFFDFRRDLF